VCHIAARTHSLMKLDFIAVLLVLFTYFLQENEHVRLDHRFKM
jgi:TRAP-type mannitol/chloroaromatic compound transport system permease small subunit